MSLLPFTAARIRVLETRPKLLHTTPRTCASNRRMQERHKQGRSIFSCGFPSPTCDNRERTTTEDNTNLTRRRSTRSCGSRVIYTHEDERCYSTVIHERSGGCATVRLYSPFDLRSQKHDSGRRIRSASGRSGSAEQSKTKDCSRSYGNEIFDVISGHPQGPQTTKCPIQ